MFDVSLMSCDDYDEKRLKDVIAGSFDNLGGAGRFMSPGDRVLLKPNLLLAKSSSTCITTNRYFVKAVAELVKDFGATPVVGDSPPIQSAASVAKKCGISGELKKIGVELVEFETPVRLDVHGDNVFKDVYIAKEALDNDCVINLPKIKSHTMMILTGCVKNMFGTVIGKEKSLWHLKAGVNKDYFARVLLEIYYAVRPALTIADMITVMEGDGPSSGSPKDVGYVLAGTDCVAMDNVACRILNIPEDAVYTMKMAKQLSDPASDFDNINVIGDDIGNAIRKGRGFRLPKRTHSDFGIPAPIRRLLRETLTGKPVIDESICEYCGSCAKICPVGGISVKRDKVSFDYEKCIKCFCCQEICPCKALKIKQGALLKILNYFG